MTEQFEDIGKDKMEPSSVHTQASSKFHKVRWTFTNFSNSLFSKEFAGPDIYIFRPILARTLFKVKKDKFYVYLCNTSDSIVQMVRIISLFDSNNEILHENKDLEVFTLHKDCYVDILNDVEDVSRFNVLPNDTLIIELTMILEGRILSEVSCTLQENFTDSRKKLIEDFKIMLEDSINSDVTLQIGDEKIPAHWSILCSRSPYFKKMFNSGMLERVQNSITITDISLCNLKRLLQFLYTAEFDCDDLEELFNLYYAADKYEVLDMRAFSVSKIMSKSTSDNVCQILQFGHQHNDNDLKMQAVDFIFDHSDAVLNTDGWKKFKASDPLAADLLSFSLKKNNC